MVSYEIECLIPIVSLNDSVSIQAHRIVSARPVAVEDDAILQG
jgi:hypothetical protein